MNTTAPLLRTPHRPLRRPGWTRPTELRAATTRVRAAARARRYDDRPEIERHASPSELALRDYNALGHRR